MLAEDRRAAIAERARAHGVVRIPDLVAEFDVSTMTIRRDLAVLAERGLIDKVHGAGIFRRDADAASHVGIVIPASRYYFPAIAEGARTVFDTRGVRRAVAVSNYDPAYDEVLARQLVDGGCTGLLLAPSVPLPASADDLKKCAWLFELPVPIVLIERAITGPDPKATLNSVRTDHSVGCAAAVHHLAQLGHRGVALVTPGGNQTAIRVIAGWRDAIQSADLDPARSPLIIHQQAIVQPAGESWPHSDAVDEVLDQIRRAEVTAIVAHGDHVAMSLLHYIRVRGWHVPRDLSIVTYDNELAELADPPLTAVAPPKQWIGRAAAELVLELEAGNNDHPVRHLLIEPSLVLRESTGAPRTAPLP